MQKRAIDVWVTGLGAMTPLGVGVADTWAALQAGENGITALDDDWAERLTVRIAAALPRDPAEMLKRTEVRRLDRCEQMALLTAREAWEDAGTPNVAP